jgi:thiol-disulfide isomerase/thioredoxin
MNLWATWCAPCKVEMPTLAALQKAYAARPVKVVAISTDTPGQTEQAKAFLAGHPPLTFYQDPQMSFMTAIKPPPQGLPLTMIFDKSGMQRAVLAGEANWSSPEAHAVIDRLLGS